MTVSVTTCLPLPPSINRTYRTTRTGGFYATREAHAWKETAILRLREAGICAVPPGTQALRVYAEVRSSDRRDIDAGVKILLDAISASCGIDDSKVVYLQMTKVRAAPRYRGMTVTVSVAGEE